VHGRINATTINSTLGQGDAGVGMRINNNESSDTRIQIDGNTISVPLGPAIDVQTRHANAPNDLIGRTDALITGNTASTTESTNAFHAIFVTASNFHTMCALITGNNGNAVSGTQHGIRPQKGTNATYQIQGYSGDGTAANVVTHLDTVNPATNDTIQALGAGYTGGTCNSPDLSPLSQAAPEPIGHSATPEEASPASTSAEAIAADTRADEANRFGMGAATTDEAAPTQTQSGDDARTTATTRNITGLSLGDIPAGGDVTVTFDVLVNGPIAVNKNYLLNQGQVTSSAPTVNTQDPGNPGPNGETRTPTDTPPTVAVTLAAGVTDPTNDNPVNFTVTFAEPVTDFDDSTDVTVGGTSGADTAVITGSGDTYNVAVSGMDNDGTVTLAVNAGAAVDEVNNANLASPSAASINYDGTAPTVTVERAAGQADPTSTSPINFTVQFSESVINLAEADISLTAPAGATATLTGSGDTYNVAVSGMEASGNVAVSIPADVAEDVAGNTNTASTTVNGNDVDFELPVAYVAADSDCASNVPCFTTVQAAINAVMNGGTVNVYGGTYDEAITLGRGITVNLVEPVTFDGSLAFDNGLLVLGSNDLTLSTDFTWSGTPSATSMIVTGGTGKVVKLWNGTGSYGFPIGETTGSADYAPVTMTITTGDFAPGAFVSVVVSDTKHPENDSTENFLTRYWTVEAGGIISYTYDAVFQYTTADVEGTVDDETKMIGARWDGVDWQGLGPVDSTNHRITGNGLTSFSDFTAGDAAPLAVTLAGFTASPSDSHVLLSWETSSEHNNAGFNVYRSTDANTSGEQLNDALIASEAPNSSQGFSYDWMDNDVEVGVTYYYWLETVSTTGAAQRHGPVSATVQVPTSVTLGSINAGAATPSLWMFAALGLTALAGLTLVRRRA
jgi:hypothetical protein